MKQFESDLKTLQSICSEKKFVLDCDVPIPADRLTFLKALDLIDLRGWADNHLQIVITDYGITYFFNKSEARKDTILHWSINFAVAVLSACFGSAFTLMLQWIIVK